MPENGSKRVSRRRMLAGASAAGAGALAAVVAAPTPAEASWGNPVLQGTVNDAGPYSTTLTSQANVATLVVNNTVTSGGAGFAVQASAALGDAVTASSGGVGGNGVRGSASNTGGNGVVGAASGTATAGVAAVANTNSNLALDVHGKARFSRSGVVTVLQGATSAVVSTLVVSAATCALANCQAAVGLAVAAAVPDAAAGTLTIVLTGKAPAGGVRVFWMLAEIP